MQSTLVLKNVLGVYKGSWVCDTRGARIGCEGCNPRLKLASNAGGQPIYMVEFRRSFEGLQKHREFYGKNVLKNSKIKKGMHKDFVTR